MTERRVRPALVAVLLAVLVGATAFVGWLLVVRHLDAVALSDQTVVAARIAEPAGATTSSSCAFAHGVACWQTAAPVETVTAEMQNQIAGLGHGRPVMSCSQPPMPEVGPSPSCLLLLRWRGYGIDIIVERPLRFIASTHTAVTSRVTEIAVNLRTQ